MRITFAGMLPFAVAAVALPAENSSPNKLDGMQQKCGDLNISCCTQIVIEGNGSSGSGLGLEGVLSTITGTLTGTPSTSNSVCGAPGLSVGTLIGNLLGVPANEQICNLPDVSYACCNGPKECHVIDPNENQSHKPGFS